MTRKRGGDGGGGDSDGDGDGDGGGADGIESPGETRLGCIIHDE